MGCISSYSQLPFWGHRYVAALKLVSLMNAFRDFGEGQNCKQSISTSFHPFFNIFISWVMLMLFIRMLSNKIADTFEDNLQICRSKRFRSFCNTPHVVPFEGASSTGGPPKSPCPSLSMEEKSSYHYHLQMYKIKN